MRRQFEADLQRVYAIFSERDERINQLYRLLASSAPQSEESKAALAPFVALLEEIGLEPNAENLLALATRLINLQESALYQVLKRSGKSEEAIAAIRLKVLAWVEAFHMEAHGKVLAQIEEEELLTPFYRALLRGIHETGIAFNALYAAWQAGLIDGINAELLKEFNHDEERILAALESAREKSAAGEESDRSYSIPRRDEAGVFRAIPYARAFPQEVGRIATRLERLSKELAQEGDGIYGEKEHYIAYFRALRVAFLEENPSELLERWREVDRAWMEVKTPLQPGHPLEYYEDRFRKAVAPEWDLRLSRVQDSAALPIKEQMSLCAKRWLERLDHEGKHAALGRFAEESIARTQLYIGIPALYYGAELAGLFSAQVVPNDERVSKEKGKKIFAFPDRVLESARHKPFMKLASEIFPADFLRQSREILFKKPELWHRVYEVSTIGHEFGHILWIDEDSELAMNGKGQFKNIEEFKATTGGLVNFFLHEDPALREALMIDLIKRAVGLVAWMEQDEVMPYYCEGLIHLHLLFESKVLEFEGEKLRIDLSGAAYERLKSAYEATYEALARHYMAKAEAGEFLERYVEKDPSHRYKPKAPACRAFVEHYWARYQAIGQVVDPSESLEDWLALKH